MKKKTTQIIKNCEHCTNAFSVERWRSKAARFCSRLCKDTNQKEDERSLTHKICSKCQKSLPVKSFYWSQNKQKYFCYCKVCRRDYQVEHREQALRKQSIRIAAQKKNNWASYRYPFLKHSAKRRKISFLISKEEFSAWYKSQCPYKCSYCELTLEELKHLGIDMSVDRIDNALGYTLDNLTLACLTCNKIKLNVLTYEDMKQIGQVVRKRLLSNFNCNCAKGFYGECPHKRAGVRAA